MNYWLVGAMWDGSDDQFDKFVRRGHWFLGWSDKQKPDFAQLRDSMRPGDRLAIKRRLGQGSPDIEIRALGIIQENDIEEKCVYVRWLVSDLARVVPSKGCLASIHGPFEEDDWTRVIFQI